MADLCGVPNCSFVIHIPQWALPLSLFVLLGDDMHKITDKNRGTPLPVWIASKYDGGIKKIIGNT